jgi:hypothetical protein
MTTNRKKKPKATHSPKPKATHSPGAWEAYDFGPEPTLDPNPRRVWAIAAEAAPEGDRMPALCYGSNAEANARLMAAAPLLLEACIELVKEVEEWTSEYCGIVELRRVALARAAIAKATTRSQTCSRPKT